MTQHEALPRVLMVDDDMALLKSAQLLLRGSYDLRTASSVVAAKSVLTQTPIDVIVVDLCFEGQENDGLHLIDWIAEKRFQIPIVVLSGDISTVRVVEATRRRLVDFIPKSDDFEKDLRIAIDRGVELRRLASSEEMIFQTRSSRCKSLLEQIDRVVASGSDCPILITGESGTGKEILSRHIASRLGQKLVTANMASVPTEMAESVLFGHVKGSFTGAVANQSGLIEQAHQGIFFLDELGDCSLAVQAKLLRVIQEHEIHPVGAPSPRKVVTRFVGATNKDLPAMVRQGTFRLDLLQRLNTITLEIPPLRERPEDIELYTQIFLADFTKDAPFSVTQSGLNALLSASWAGNVRELRSTIERMIILAERRVLDEELARQFISVALNVTGTSRGDSRDSKKRSLRTDIMSALEKTDGNRTEAARLLKMHTSTLFRWMNKLELSGAVEARNGRPPTPLRLENERPHQGES